MVEPSLLYFFNSDGAGHRQRAQAIMRHLDMPVVGVAEMNPPNFYLKSRQYLETLPPLRLGNDDGRLADDTLHMPYGSRASYLPRLARLSEIATRYNVHYAMIDVCAETAMTMRLAGIPYCYMRMHGKRDDAAHQQVYKAADCLISSYPALLEQSDVAGWINNKTSYMGGIVNIDDSLSPTSRNKPIILMLRGKGSNGMNAELLKMLAEHFDGYHWIGIGFDEHYIASNCEIHSFVSNTSAYLKGAALVIGSTGNNVTLEAGYYQKPFITCPEKRYFNEQYCKAEILQQLGLAVIADSWKVDTDYWQSLINSAFQLDMSKWKNVISPDGAKSAAAILQERFVHFSDAYLQAM